MNKPIIGITQGKTPYWQSTEVYSWEIKGGGQDPFQGSLKGNFSIRMEAIKDTPRRWFALGRSKNRLI